MKCKSNQKTTEGPYKAMTPATATTAANKLPFKILSLPPTTIRDPSAILLFVLLPPPFCENVPEDELVLALPLPDPVAVPLALVPSPPGTWPPGPEFESPGTDWALELGFAAEAPIVIFSPVARRELKTVALSPSMTVLFVPALSLYV